MKKGYRKILAFTLAAAVLWGSWPATSVLANPYPGTQDVDRDGLYEVPCTRFAWQMVHDRLGIALPAWGNGVNWWQNAINQGYATGREPLAGSVAVWSGDYYGHVAYVTSGSGNTFTVDEGGRTDRDHTASHGVEYGYTLKNHPVGTGRPYDPGKTLLGFIYPWLRMPGKPSVSVNPGVGGQSTTISWNGVDHARHYDLRIYKAGQESPVVEQYAITGTSWSVVLSEGSYQATVAAVNDPNYAYHFSDRVSFTVAPPPPVHTHAYETVTVKATTKKDGYTQEQCGCGDVKNKQIIYYPGEITLSKTRYVYDGKAKKPSVKVVGRDGKVISSENYTLSYSGGRKKAGTYKVTVTFRNRYSGKVTRIFRILEKGHKHTYKKKVSKATTKKNGYVQSECSCGAVTGKKTIYYPEKITLSKTEYFYDGKTKTPKVKVVDSNKKTLGTGNYTVTYPKSRKKTGTYKVTIRFKGNYTGSVTRTFRIVKKPKEWVYVDRLPDHVTSDKYRIEYKHTYVKTTSSYVNDGGVYESLTPLATSNERVLVDYYYYHFCGPTTGDVVNYDQTGGFVHYDSVASDRVTVAASGPDGDNPNISYYLLNWKGTNDRVWCASGVTCDGAYGSHGSRGMAWYRMNRYQNKKLQTRTTTTESDWTTGRDSKADKTTYRYRAK